VYDTRVQVVGEFQTFAKETGRKLHLEIEPGTFLLANSACIVSTIQDMVTTGEDGYTFLKMDTCVPGPFIKHVYEGY
jgi:diaminopimelate decarboxylase